ncbi:MAG: DUF4129 domain-containing protein [Gemmatimonadales bacterium]
MPAQGSPDPASLRSILDTVFAAPVYRWAEEPGPLRALREWWQRLGEWLSGLRADNPTVFRVLVLLLLLTLLGLLAHAAWVVWQTIRTGGGPTAEAATAPRRDTRDAAWYYREADRAASAGRISEALQLAFVGLALTLDSQGLLRYHPSKTPAECAREANLAGTDRERLRELVRSLYAYVFGGRPCAAADYRRWREAGAHSWNAPAH